MKTPTLEEVKKMYSNVKEVEGTCGVTGVLNLHKIYTGISDCICCMTEDNKSLILYDSENNGYAKILSYKSNIDLSKLTPDLITELCKDDNVKEILINNGVVKNELEETYIKIPLSEINSTKSDEKLGALVRSIASNY